MAIKTTIKKLREMEIEQMFRVDEGELITDIPQCYGYYKTAAICKEVEKCPWVTQCIQHGLREKAMQN